MEAGVVRGYCHFFTFPYRQIPDLFLHQPKQYWKYLWDCGIPGILLLWVYYSSIILFFGAEFTKSYAVQMGSEIYPAQYAVKNRNVEVEEGKGSITRVHKEDTKEKSKR